MYSRGYDRGIESDGSLRELERDFEENRLVQEAAHQEPTLPASVGKGKGKLFSRIDTEDLLIIAIAILILLDGDPDNDIILIALALLLFF